MAEARYKRGWRNISRHRKALMRSLEIYLSRATFLFDADMGKRMVEVRKSMELTQREFGKLFDLSQSDVYRLERGKLRTLPVTSAQFISALPDYYHYVLFGGVLSMRKSKHYSENDTLDKKRRRRIHG